jgi:uncharacterized protein with PIN domain
VKVSILNVNSDILIQTVTITDNKKNPSNLFLFHCYHCGTGIQRIKGEVTRINAGMINEKDTLSALQCHRCKEHYFFQTVHAKPSVIKLTLSLQQDREVSTFHCIVCRQELIQYSDNVIARLPLMQLMKTPSLFGCTNCGKDYLLNEIVSAIA